MRLTNIAEGNVAAGSTDAVNGAQLRRATDGTAAALGGGATANPDGSISAPAYKVGGGSFNNVGDALTNLDGRVGSNTTTLENHETRIGNAENEHRRQYRRDRRAATGRAPVRPEGRRLQRRAAAHRRS